MLSCRGPSEAGAGGVRLSDPFWTLVAMTRLSVVSPSVKGRAAKSGAGDEMSVPPQGSVGESPVTSPTSDAGDNAFSAQGRSAAAPLAAGAFVVCVAAFVLGLVPLLGATLGLVGIVLVILAVRRGVATKRTFVAAAVATVGTLTSLAMAVLLVGAALVPGGERDPDPVATSGTPADPEEEPETVEDTIEEEPSTQEKATTVPSPTEAQKAEPTGAEEPEPTEDPEPSEEPLTEPAVETDRGAYEELDERGLAQIVKAPDDHFGRQVVLYGSITQLDAATGSCIVRVSVAHAPQEEWYDYEHNTIGFAGDGESDCPVLDPFVADDEVKMWVMIGGSLSYDTQIGGSTTVPSYLIEEMELL